MTFWQRLFGPKFIILDAPKLSEEKLAGAFAVAVTDERFRAVLQVIDELEQEANDGARKSVGNHGMSASCNGGAEHLAMLRNRILMLQQQGFGKLDSERKIA